MRLLSERVESPNPFQAMDAIETIAKALATPRPARPQHKRPKLRRNWVAEEEGLAKKRREGFKNDPTTRERMREEARCERAKLQRTIFFNEDMFAEVLSPTSDHEPLFLAFCAYLKTNAST